MAPKKKATAAAKQEEKKAEENKVEEKKAEEVPAQKRKAEEETKEDVSEPPQKEAKKEEAVEQEQDASVDKRSKLKDAIGFSAPSTTLNVVPTMDGKVLNAFTDAGMRYLVSGARANVGMKAGRYLFEVKVLEALPVGDVSGWNARTNGPAPKQMVRLGFSTAGSPLVLGDSEEHVFFDGEGSFYVGKNKTAASKAVAKDKTVAVLLNLDPKSPNAKTVSLFCDGQRISEPKPLPENLHGKTLFPHVSYRNVTLQVHMGPEPMKALPFKCRSIGGAADADVVKEPKMEPKDGKYEVMIPVGFPDEGTFNWLDGYLQKNPQYVELSDRKILEWAASSGLWRSKGWKGSNDKPEFNFGIPEMDSFSVRRMINSIAAVVPRNYVIMEVKSNLVEAERKEVLQRFSGPHFRKVAHVVMGEPSTDFKKLELDKMLKEKQQKSDALWQAKKVEKERKKVIADRQKQIAEAKKKFEEEKKKKAEEAAQEKKKDEDEKEGEEKKEEEKKEEEGKMEVDEGASKDEEKKDEAMEDEEEETEPPKVELTDEEKAKWFHKPATYDLTNKILNQTFASFSIPEKSEGFEEVRFEWQKEAKSKEYLSKWVLERKRTARIDNLQPSAWFQETWKAWQKTFAEWQAKQGAFKASPAGAEAEMKSAGQKEGQEDNEEKAKEKGKGDIFSVKDVNDVGNGEPLFKNFAFEDWALLQLRYEMFLLQAAFKKDVNDSDRPGIHESHFAFYFNRYYWKNPNAKAFGVDSHADLVKLVKETVAFEEEFLTAKATCEPDDFAMFVMLGEENRRERQWRIDAGDETARLKFLPQALPQAAAGTGSGSAQGEAKGKGTSHWQAAPRQSWAVQGSGWKGKGKGGGKSGWRW